MNVLVSSSIFVGVWN
ncbi:unnamed protein product [Spirodela intermedia]|uniref:Uncharacterized protein n=1 Tax=Spirodela intermedia TaxID=51605 RepID=A0A7I8IDJ8_SPIIN|nr:unnamed protein product [Spirodela intermedia]CAA6655868.1 unnamed protein product [Spirodela intermedia]